MGEKPGLTTISESRVVVNMIKEFLRHPFLKASGVLGEAERSWNRLCTVGEAAVPV